MIEACPSLMSAGRSCLDRLLVGIRDDHVEGVVDQRAALRERRVVVDDLAQIEPAMLGGEGDQRGVAAEGRRGRGALEGVGVHQPAGRDLLDMGMRIDAARQDELAGRVDLARALAEPAADRRDLAVLHRDIGDEMRGRCADGAAANDQVEGLRRHAVLRQAGRLGVGPLPSTIAKPRPAASAARRRAMMSSPPLFVALMRLPRPGRLPAAAKPALPAG